MADNELVPSEEPRQPTPVRPPINIPAIPHRDNTVWKTALVLVGSGLLSLGGSSFSNYLQTRGFVSVQVARIFLGITWLSGVLLIVICVMAFGLKYRAIIIGSALVILTGTLFGLEFLATRSSKTNAAVVKELPKVVQGTTPTPQPKAQKRRAPRNPVISVGEANFTRDQAKRELLIILKTENVGDAPTEARTRWRFTIDSIPIALNDIDSPSDAVLFAQHQPRPLKLRIVLSPEDENRIFNSTPSPICEVSLGVDYADSKGRITYTYKGRLNFGRGEIYLIQSNQSRPF